MAAVKKLNTSYTIDSTDVTITGNLTVFGTRTTIQSVNASIKDNSIVLNSGETGAGVTLGVAGIEINRGSALNVAIQWTELNSGHWQLLNAAGYTANIVTSTTGMTKLSDDTLPILSSNLNTFNKIISSNIGNINFSGNIAVGYPSAIPAAVANASVLYTSIPGAGTTGIYVVNALAVNEELITKKRSFAFSLIL